MPHRFSVLVVVVVVVVAVVATACEASALEPVASFGSNPGALAMFEHVPAGTSGPMPLVLALHGCTEDRTYATDVGLEALADAHGFALVVAEQSASNNQNKCFDWYQTGDIERDAGEALSLKQMIDSMKSRHAIDDGRVFVTGLSAGGAMTAVMLATYPDVFAAGAIFAGVPYGCAHDISSAFTCMYTADNRSQQAWADVVTAANAGGPMPRVSIWAGTSDTTVSPVNADELVVQWTGVHGISSTASSTTSIGTATRETFGADASGLPLVESVRVPGMNHGTPVDPAHGCGTAAPYILDVGICSSEHILAFFGLATDDTAGEGEASSSEGEGEGSASSGDGEGEGTPSSSAGEGEGESESDCARPGDASGCAATSTAPLDLAAIAMLAVLVRRRALRR